MGGGASEGGGQAQAREVGVGGRRGRGFQAGGGAEGGGFVRWQTRVITPQLGG